MISEQGLHLSYSLCIVSYFVYNACIIGKRNSTYEEMDLNQTAFLEGLVMAFQTFSIDG